MIVYVNGQAVSVFQGATALDALLRHFAKCDIDRRMAAKAVICDQWGHVIGPDSPLRAEQSITYQLK